MESAFAYLPADRRNALAGGAPIHERAIGAALFADISGFTPLTEALAQSLGPRRGAEELARQINRVYDTLVALVDSYGGSVISFSGDAITCWFAEAKAKGKRQKAKGPAAKAKGKRQKAKKMAPPAFAFDLLPSPAQRAVSCALALQRAMATFEGLTLKVAVASGPARRMLVGEASVQLLDALAGATLARLARAEHLAERGEVLADAATAEALAGVRIGAWRRDGDERFAVVAGLDAVAQEARWPALAPDALGEDETRKWLLPAVYERLRDGLGEFLTELRPAVALFMRFSGIDYDGDDDAGAKLDTLVRRVQAVVTGYGGSLLQLTIGDKGSYLYAAFGAPVAHEDDPRRAVLAALALQALPDELPFLLPVQIGLSRGTMRTGAYGGTTRRTYGALGDEVNLAARLMQHAAPGEVLASGRVYEAVSSLFGWETLSPIRVKGKSEPVPIARLVGAQVQARDAGAFAGELVGREAELEALVRFVAPVFAGRFAGVASVYGEAGMGKSRLVHELRGILMDPANRTQMNADFEPQIIADQTKNVSDLRESAREGLRKSASHSRIVLWHTLPADELLRESLGPARRWLRAHFAQRPGDDGNRERFDAALDALEEGLGGEDELREELRRTRPFLAALVDLRTEGSLYEQLDARLRFENTLAAIKALVLAQSKGGPVVLHVEDAHWLDDDTRALLALLARNVEAYPIALLLTSRYADDGTPPPPPVDADAPQIAVDLAALPADAVRAVAAQALGAPVADDLAALLADKTGGNPFFAEQLALDLRERGALTKEKGKSQKAKDHIEGGASREEVGADPSVASSAFSIQHSAFTEVPETITAVLVARLDRLAAQVRAVVQTAAVLGQEFEVRVLSAMLRGDARLPERVREAAQAAIWTALSEIRYLFRHALLRDAAYDMQLHERLCALHALAGESLEHVYADDLAPYAAALAFHYARAERPEQERVYSRMAGERAAALYANADAAKFFSRALQLTAENELAERYALLLAREQVEDMLAAREAQRADLDALALLAEQLDDVGRRVEVALREARYADVTSDYPAMIAAAQRAIAQAQAAGDVAGEAAGHLHWARALWYQGSYDEARAQATRALELAQAAQLKALEADSLRVLGNAELYQSQYLRAIQAYEPAVRLQKELNDRQAESYTLNNLGVVAWYQGNYFMAQDYYVQSLTIKRKIGDIRGEAMTLLNLGEVSAVQGDFINARIYYELSLRCFIEVDDSYNRSLALTNLGDIAVGLGQYTIAQRLLEEALTISRAIGHRQQENWALVKLTLLMYQYQRTPVAFNYAEESLQLSITVNDQNAQSYALTHMGHISYTVGQFNKSTDYYQRAVELRRELEQQVQLLEPLAGLARVAIAHGKAQEALTHIEPVLKYLEQNTLDGTDEPFRIHLTVYQVLQAATDPRAYGVLERAHALLQERASKLDEATRRSFLEQVPHHRELVAAWQALLRNEAP